MGLNLLKYSRVLGKQAHNVDFCFFSIRNQALVMMKVKLNSNRTIILHFLSRLIRRCSPEEFWKLNLLQSQANKRKRFFLPILLLVFVSPTLLRRLVSLVLLLPSVPFQAVRNITRTTFTILKTDISLQAQAWSITHKLFWWSPGGSS